MKVNYMNEEISSFGNTDIYLLDQILKGRFKKSNKILDVGCGEGRNLTWFLRNAFDVYGIDANPSAIQMLRFYSASQNEKYKDEKERFIIGSAGDLPFAPNQFDVIIHSAVAHFSENKSQFINWWEEALRVLKPNGIFFMRTAVRCFVKESDDNVPFTFIPDYSLIELLVSNHELLEPLKIVEVPSKKREMATIIFKKVSSIA
ncbi:class I SAM-dependent methyltransferase [Mangrovivirga sp. M17]|uniref:Class I SAM-dependent methyltransferase n=1 Tax=Mangrovivirga halotolerans TaxID=2993936 RepID=A0ABT3RTA4_9BACT|nr:class I SAM-dependent methyltransferase [Mangrovivirga halotolerans]MCX2744813.1 class I SAM-dependent methyltransferase [Mangrovivirga halotolerans]